MYLIPLWKVNWDYSETFDDGAHEIFFLWLKIRSVPHGCNFIYLKKNYYPLAYISIGLNLKNMSYTT